MEAAEFYERKLEKATKECEVAGLFSPHFPYLHHLSLVEEKLSVLRTQLLSARVGGNPADVENAELLYRQGFLYHFQQNQFLSGLETSLSLSKSVNTFRDILTSHYSKHFGT